MKKIFKHKVISGALQFTIFIGVIIALILAGLVMLQNTHNFFIQQSKSTIENIQLANSGIMFLRQQKNLIADTITIDQLSRDNEKVQVQSSLWGIYEKAIVKTTHRKKIFYKSALLGTQIDNLKRSNLYLQDNFKPLVLVGNTILKGNAFLPAQGVKPGYIAGEGFYGVNLINGASYKSDDKLPKLRDRYKESIEQLSKFQVYKEENYLRESEIVRFTNSFLKPTKIWNSKSEIILSNNELSGNIIIQSEQKITVKKSATLKDIILIAPIIIIEDEVSGNFQVICNKQIKVGVDCKLNYPSALVLLEKKDEVTASQMSDIPIFIDKRTEIRGSILYLKAIKKNDFNTQVILNEESIIKGEVYCEGNLELKGKVVGSVYTEQFVVNKAGSVFINHIYNGQIANDNFPNQFCGLLFKDNQKSVAKWMY